ncbi:replication factor C large subunit, partial [Methanosalsum natronophilum]
MMTIDEWAEKYRPRSLSEIVGNKKAIETMSRWADEWIRDIPEKKALLLTGKAGIGKTSAAHALAADFGWDIIELNASDKRTADAVERIAGSASTMHSLDGSTSKRLIILDEADNLHGTSDRGGTRAIGKMVKETNQPIILIANDMYGVASTIRSYSVEVKFNSIQTRSMIPLLKRIAVNENIKCGVGVLEKIAEGADGDLRSALNDFQAVSMGRDEVNLEDIVISARDTQASIFKVLPKIFKGHNIVEAYRSVYSLDESPEDLIHWIDENLIYQYMTDDKKINEDIINGLFCLSRSDIYLGRVKKRQNYGLWKYASMMMTAGVLVSGSKRKSGFVRYQPPSMWRRLGQLRTKRNLRDNVSVKIGEHCNESMRYSRSNLIPLYSHFIKNENNAIDAISR